MKRVEAPVNKIGIFIFLLLISCSSDDDAVNPNGPNNPPNPPGGPVVQTPQTCLITSVELSTLSYVITRNDLGLPTKVRFTKYAGAGIDYSCTFEYDDSNRLIKLQNETISLTYTYDNLSRLISEKLVAQPNPKIPHIKDIETTFTYNDEGFLDSAYHSPGDYQRYIYDDDGNLIKRFIKYPGQPEFLIQEYLEFDDKKNPYYEFSFSHNTILDLSGVVGVVTTFNPVRHKTNVLQTKVYQSNGTFTLYNVTYNYNDSGYPISGDHITAYGYQCK